MLKRIAIGNNIYKRYFCLEISDSLSYILNSYTTE